MQSAYKRTSKGTVESMPTRFTVPDCIKEKCDQAKYRKWLHAKASAHVRRDRKRFGKEHCGVSQYKIAIHAAVSSGGDRDYYTGEPLDWSLISTYANAESVLGKTKYKAGFALLPTVDHTLDEAGRQRFVICSWRVNDAKSDCTEAEFAALCEAVTRHRGLGIDQKRAKVQHCPVDQDRVPKMARIL